MEQQSLTLQDAQGIVTAACRQLRVSASIKVVWNARLRTSMGRAKTNWMRVPNTKIRKILMEGHEIQLNPHLFQRASLEKQRDTVLHETAHIIADIRQNKPSHHGPAWQKVMRELGQNPTRCHSISTEGLRRRQSRYTFDCPNDHCEAVFNLSKGSRTRHMRALQRGRGITCTRCHTALAYEHYLAAKPLS